MASPRPRQGKAGGRSVAAAPAAANVEPPAPSSPAPRTERAPGPWYLNLLAAFLVPALLLGLLEAGLRLFGYGYPTPFFLGARVGGRNVRIENDLFTLRFFPPALLREPDPLALSAPKPEGTYRIFVLGESAAKGDPEPAYSFSRILQVMLRDRYPGQPFEVLNTAITAINSNVILPIARDCARQQPDLFVVYMGNNEVVGPFGPATVFSPFTRSLRLIRANVALKSTRTGQLLANLLNARQGRDAPAGWGGMAMFLRNQVPLDDRRLPSVYDHFRANLADIITAGRKAGAAVVLCTVPTNLRDCPPLASAHRRELSPARLRDWESTYRGAVALEREGRHAEALARYQQAAAVDDRFADLQFRMARCLGALGRHEEARKRYLRARDLDSLRFRADTRLNDTVRALAAPGAAHGLYLADTERALESAAPWRTPGKELFYEHVHLNFRGNYLFARTVLSQVDRAMADQRRITRAPRGGPLPERECARRLALTDWNRYKIAADMVDRLAKPPFTNQIDHELSLARLEQQAKQMRAFAAPGPVRAAKEAYRQALWLAPEDWVLHDAYGKLLLQGSREPAAAEEQFRWVLSRLPHNLVTRVNLGLALSQQGKSEEAIAQYRDVLRVRPSSLEARANLAVALAEQGRTEEALDQYGEALKLDPNSAVVRWNLGNLLRKQGRTEEAAEQYRRALKLQPDMAEAHQALAAMLSEGGSVGEAMPHLQEAARLAPDNAEAQLKLGVALARQGQLDAAGARFAEAVRLDPNLAEAHYNLARYLAGRHRVDEAILHLRAAVRSRPGLARAHADLGGLLAARGDAAEAVQQLQLALRADPDLLPAHNNLARILSQLGRSEEAITHYREALRIDPNRPEVHNNLGVALKRAGRIDEAVEEFRLALRGMPGSPEVQRNLQGALALRGTPAPAR